MKINSLKIDSSKSITDLCLLGKKYPTDKSPYNTENYLTENGSGHRHPYTAVYDLLFSSLRHKNIKLAEIGILDSMSLLMWRDYFPYAELYGFDICSDSLENCKSLEIKNCYLSYIDVEDESSIVDNLKKFGKYDIIVEDSTHEFEDQIRLCNVAHNFLNVGGILIIEDIFRSFDEKQYFERLENVLKYYSSIYFINTEHDLKFSPDWDNDKLLILIRNEIL
jgi:hypothetical protein